MVGGPGGEERPGLAALGLCADGQGRVLLLRRVRDPYGGLWSLPGGKPEAGEGLAATCRRELREELGVDAPCLRLRLLVQEHLTLGPGGAALSRAGHAEAGSVPQSAPPMAHWLLAIFACRLEAGGRLQAEAAWFAADALPADMIATDRLFVADALEDRAHAAFRYLRAHLDAGRPVVTDYA